MADVMTGTGKRARAARFSAAAGTYDEHDRIQRAARAGLIPLLEPLSPPASILEIGCGTGLLTEWLCRRWPGAALTALDLSPGMLARARARLGGAGNVRWVEGAAEDFRPERAFVLVVSNCALHWMTPFTERLARIAECVAPDGRIAASVMLAGTLGELHAARRAAAPGVPPAAALPEATAIHAGLEAAGCIVETWREETRVEVLPSARAVLEGLHAQGVTGAPLGGGARPLNRAELARLMEHYERQCRTDAGVPATYRIGWFRGWREAGHAAFFRETRG